MIDNIYNGRDGTAGGTEFGAALAALATEREIPHERLAEALGTDAAGIAAVLDGSRRIGPAGMAALALALRSKPIDFLQKTGVLGLAAYAGGLDPLYFLPEGPTRYDARIYMREINPRHAVPENDMTRRNPAMKALGEDQLLDALGHIELEMVYLLRTAVQELGPNL